MGPCTVCKKREVGNKNHDLCHGCWDTLEKKDKSVKPEKKFVNNLTSGDVHAVYVMFYGNRDRKIGYTKNLGVRLLQHRYEHPGNRLVYFREFPDESTARRFEAWLKELPERNLTKLVIAFQNSARQVEM